MHGRQGEVQQVQVDHGIVREKNQVVTKFSIPVDNLTGSPAQAVETATKMLECAFFLDPESVKDITWPTKGKVMAPGGSSGKSS